MARPSQLEHTFGVVSLSTAFLLQNPSRLSKAVILLLMRVSQTNTLTIDVCGSTSRSPTSLGTLCQAPSNIPLVASTAKTPTPSTNATPPTKSLPSEPVSHRIFLLEQQAVYPLPAHLQLEAEAITNLRYEGVQHADQKCRKLHFGGAAYTPEFSRLEAALKTHHLLLAWRLHTKAVSSSIIKRHHIKSKMKTTLSELYGMDIPTLCKAATEAYKAYRRYWDHTDVSRDTWLEDLAKARAVNEQAKKERL
jgi:hypothetical protein